MTRGIRKHPKNRSCKICKESFLALENNTLYCSNCKTENSRYHILTQNYESRLFKLAAMAKNRAKAKQLPFTISGEYLTSLWNENQGCCALTGIPFELKHSGSKGQVHPAAPSVDRIIPKLGYIEGNVRLITYHMNIALSEFGLQGFEDLVEAYKGYNT